MVEDLWAVWLSLAPWLLLGMSIASLIHILLPPGFINQHLAGRGGVLKAVSLGIPLPLCSCGVIPAALGIKRDGASDGASVGFMISTPQTGVDSILVSASFLGWPFALFKMLAALLTGLFGGWLVDLSEPNHTQPIASGPHEETGSKAPGIKRAYQHAMEILGSIWHWLILGAVVSVLITNFLPQTGFEETLAGSPWMTLGLVFLISTPLYVCATASVPIAAALVAQGLPMGAALVFLMAGPATNVATIGAILKTFGKKHLAIYLVTILGGSVLFGLGFDQFVTLPTIGHHHAHHNHSAFEHLCGVALVLLMIPLAWQSTRQLYLRISPPAPTSHEKTWPVEGMTCNGCAKKLTQALEAHPQVTRAVVNAQTKKAVVTGNISKEVVTDIIQSTGFRVGA